MKNKPAIINYDPEADILTVENDARTLIEYAQEMGNIIVHFSKKGQPVLIEMLEASKLLKHQSKSLKTAIRRVLIPA